MEDFIYEGAVNAPQSDDNYCYNCEEFKDCVKRKVELPSYVFESEYEHQK